MNKNFFLNWLMTVFFITMIMVKANASEKVKMTGQMVKSENQVSFTENKGQISDQNQQARPDVLFCGESGGLVFHLKRDGISYQVSKFYPRLESGKEEFLEENDSHSRPEMRSDCVIVCRIDIKWFNASTDFSVESGSQIEGFNNYYLPVCPNGVLGVKSYRSVTFKDVWHGIDITWYEKNGALEYDFTVAPGADPSLIQWRIEGSLSSEISALGELSMSTAFGSITESAPVAFQGENTIPISWKLENDIVSLKIEGYDRDQPLIIDPVLTRKWSTFYGGNGDEDIKYMSLDPNGNIYLAGGAYSSSSIATSGAHQTSLSGSNDAMLIKLDSNGIRNWATYYGGSAADYGWGCAIDGSSAVYLSGSTASSTAIATSGGFYSSYRGGSGDGFLVKFNSSGVRQWGTYYGGSNADGGLNCAVDAASNVYLTGFTMSSGMATSGAHQTSSGGIIDHYLAKFTSSGSRVWSTYYGGSNLDEFTDIAVQDSSYIFLSGQTQSSNNIATTGSHQSALASGGTIPDAFLVKFNTAGVRQWGTYYGGSNYESGLGVAVDHNGNSYLCGWTRSSGMATSGAFKTSYSGNDDGFLVKFNSSGVRQWATYYGGTAFDWNYDMDVDQLGDIYIIGGTTSASGISVAGTYQNSLAGLGDWFLVKMNSSGQRTYSTYFGGIMGETPSKVAVTSNLKIVLSGKTATSTGLATTGAHQSSNGGMSDGLIVMFSQCANGSELVTSACSSYTSPSGLHTWTSSGIYTDVFTNAQGCDSIITINLTILNNDTTLDVTACVNYKSANGNIYTSSGTYIDTIMNSFGCDSVITVDLTIVSVDDSLFVSNNVITANATSASFQWIDCNTMTTLQGETGNSLTVIQNGSYAVIVNQSGCSDTSECIDVNWIGLEEYNNQEFRIYPVPTNDQIIIECKKSLAPFRVDIIGPLGEVVLTYDNLISSINRLDVSGLPGAVYTLRIEHNGIVGHKRFIKE